MPVDRRAPAPFSFASQPRRRSTTSDPTLFDSLPVCARTCTLYYVHEGFRCDATDLSCLCSSYNTEGYTLGEIALICLSSQCSEFSDGGREEAYNICVNQSGAAKATHTVLSSASLPTIASTSVLSLTDSGQASATTTTVAQASATIASSTLSTTASASTLAGRKSDGSTTLSTAQAVGISVAALGTVIIAIAGFFLTAYLRRRKARRQKHPHHSYDFVDDAPARLSPFKHGFADPQGPLGGSAMPRGDLLYEKHQTAWPVANTTRASPQQPRGMGPDRSPRTVRSITPESLRSDGSMRTVSQLLPERPGSRPPEPPAKSPRRPSVYTPATAFEEERSPVIPRALYPGLPPHPAAFKTRQLQFPQQYTQSPEQMRLPILSLSIPGKPYTVREANVSTDFELLPPPPAVTFATNDRCDSVDSGHRSSGHSLLKYYASVESGSPEEFYAATPIEEQTQVRRPPPAAIHVTKPVFPPRAVRTSTASDASRRTSFESTDPDEPTPPEEEDKRLTPVAESPIAAIRYPKVPRSSNQSVPRSPGHQLSPKSVEWAATRYQLHDGQMSSRHSPSPSGSTLAAKRRGNTAQQDLELGLRIHDPAYAFHSRSNSQQASSILQSQKVHPLYRHESPLNGYGRIANKGQRDTSWPLPTTVEAAMKSPPLRSPLWEPKLTPRRRGDDLFLSVSIATPLNAHFRR